MKKKIFLTALSLFVLLQTGCQPALITASKWDSGTKSSPLMQTRCVQVDLRDSDDMEDLFKKFDGWKVIYISEYTTKNRFGTDAAVCFEREMPESDIENLKEKKKEKEKKSNKLKEKP